MLLVLPRWLADAITSPVLLGYALVYGIPVRVAQLPRVGVHFAYINSYDDLCIMSYRGPLTIVKMWANAYKEALKQQKDALKQGLPVRYFTSKLEEYSFAETSYAIEAMQLVLTEKGLAKALCEVNRIESPEGRKDTLQDVTRYASIAEVVSGHPFEF